MEQISKGFRDKGSIFENIHCFSYSSLFQFVKGVSSFQEKFLALLVVQERLPLKMLEIFTILNFPFHNSLPGQVIIGTLDRRN